MHNFSFPLGAAESFALLGCYIAFVGSCVLRNSLAVPFSRLRQPKKMGTIGCPEKSINSYQTMLRKTPERRISPSSLLSQFILRLSSSSSYIFFLPIYRLLSFGFCLCFSLFIHFNARIMLRLVNRECPKVRTRCSNY